ncbi:hypothetical protein BELL_0017g00260 [Botrytis elliptica]|uniref:Uncharacterized protein n=1 Tax=Botrytis elliptica TaxID=278938 RepID=A0A4Z1K1J1_9HELO|nr:hypothetical protein BELL_0017g00260 [Botrytis elliptica]
MSHQAMQDPPIPLETGPDSLMPQSLLSLPSLKQYMVHRLVHEGTTIITMEAALSHYASHYHTMANFPRQYCYLTPGDREVIHRAYSNIPVERLNAMNDQLYRAQQQRCLQLYVQEAQAWSKSIEDKIAQMEQKGEKIEDHEADDHRDEGLQQLAQLEYIAFRVTQEFLKGANEKPIRPSNVLEALQLTRPDEEFPRENAHVLLGKEEGKATKKSESIAGKIKQGNKQDDTQSRQNEAAELAPQHKISNTNKSVKTTNFRQGSRPKQNAVTRGRTKALGDTKGIDLGILTIQRRKEYRRKLKQNLSSKKQTAEASARALSKRDSKASVLSENSHILQGGLEKAQSASLSTQLQSRSSEAAATTARKDSNPLGESKPLEDSRHSSEIAQDLQLNHSSNRLQTLDEMIEEEKEIASQLGSYFGMSLAAELELGAANCMLGASWQHYELFETYFHVESKGRVLAQN